MTKKKMLSPGDRWPHHYRGLSLQVSPNGDVWWQLYQGTDRLILQPSPNKIVDQLLDLKRIGGRIHVTELGDVLTRVEKDDDDYEQVYVGTIEDLHGELTPEDNSEYSIDFRPRGLEPGDLWPSIYDGSRYSFADDRVWWHNGQSHRRHPVPAGIPDKIKNNLKRYKPSGGSFRVLPWGDVITLISLHPSPRKVREQFNELPRVVKNIIKLRKSRDVEMLPIYIGSINSYRIETEEPTSLTDNLSKEEQDSLSSWAEGLGRTNTRKADSHRADQISNEGGSDARGASKQNGSTTSTGHSDEGEAIDDSTFDDDPLEWMREDMTRGTGEGVDSGDS
ncbi:hypothetical protein [Halalkalirubrum salinum]|uniref:hypothetical protein n=1 Tax=Halalkalirubrum salinum TaxID=2563889 RepID=UPI0010FADBA8|nr:hypothetical protein [Halalkalirubrum salinum]